MLIVDPPEGWKYGFPKPIPLEIFDDDYTFESWLLEQGYPKDKLELAVNYSRYWEWKEDKDDKE